MFFNLCCLQGRFEIFLVAMGNFESFFFIFGRVKYINLGGVPLNRTLRRRGSLPMSATARASYWTHGRARLHASRTRACRATCRRHRRRRRHRPSPPGQGLSWARPTRSLRTPQRPQLWLRGHTVGSCRSWGLEPNFSRNSFIFFFKNIIQLKLKAKLTFPTMALYIPTCIFTVIANVSTKV